MPIVVPQLAPPGTLAIDWVDPSGIVRSLLPAADIVIEYGGRGFGVPGLDLVEEKLPYVAGTVVRHAAIQSRHIELPILFGPGLSSSALESLMDSVHGWFATADEAMRTPGYLRVTLTGGTQRQIACYYDGGLEGDLSPGKYGPGWQRAVIRLLAADPWATDIADTVYTWDAGDLPNQTIINTGQLDAFPMWTITGPVSIPQIVENATTGQSWQLNVAVADGGLASHVDTRPANQRSNLSVYRHDGLALYRYIEPGSDLWTLAPGQNNLIITLSGTNSNTTIELRYRARYRGLYL